MTATLQEQITEGMTNAKNADADELRRRIIRTELYLIELKRIYGDLTGGDRVTHADVLEAARLQTSELAAEQSSAGFIPTVDLMLDQSQIDELLIEDAAQPPAGEDLQQQPDECLITCGCCGRTYTPASAGEPCPHCNPPEQSELFEQVA